MTLNGERLSEPNQNRRPDAVFEGRIQRRGRQASRDQATQENENRMLELVDFSCPYGRISHRKETLELTYEYKKEK
jgi:hypothetical protein